MTVVQNTATDPGGAPLANTVVRITLITSSPNTPGFTDTGEINGTFSLRTDANGHWSTTLTPNSEITPANTYYQVVEGRAVSPIVVPASGGPYELADVLATPPPTPDSPGITGIAVAADGTIAGTRAGINLVAGSGITVAAADNPADERVDVTLTATGGGGGGAVSSVFGRTGDVLAQTGDYSADQISGLGSAATHAATDFDQAGAATTAQANAVAAAEANAASTYVPLSALPLPVTSGGTGSATKSFVDLTAAQSVAGVKTFTSAPSVPTPAGASDATPKSYVDSVAQGLAVKASVIVATAAALPANTYSNGASGLGATLTATANGALSIDGYSVAAGDRVLVQNEAAAANNGIYQVTATGSAGAPYVLTRTLDFDLAAQIPGSFVFVERGTANAAAGFTCTTLAPVVFGTSAITWTQFSGAGEISAGNGLTKTGNSIALAGPVSLANGGTGAASQQAAINALTGTQQAGAYLRSDGTNATLSAIQAGDVPILNQSTTGTAGGLSATLAVGSGGTGATNAANARANLGLTGSVPYSADTPAQRGWAEWNFAPSQGSVAVSQNFTSGTIYGINFIAQTNLSISKVGVQVVSSAGTPTSGQNGIAFYAVSGTTANALTATGDLGSWSSATFQAYALGASQTLVAGTTYILLFMSNATTPVHLQGITSDTAAQIGFLNLGLSNTAAPWLKFFVYGTGQTALPGSFSISGTTMSATNALAPWACLL